MTKAELLALTPEDFDFTTHTLRINKSYQRLNREDVITPPKTFKSNRFIKMPQFICDEMQDYMEMLYGLKEDERIFTISKSYLHHEMNRGSKVSGVKRIRVHDLRHSHAAFLINKGVQPLMIKERFGHTDIRITLNTYGHLYPDQQKVVADMLDDENIKSSGSTNNRSNVTNGDESTNVNPRQVDYSRDSSREQQRIGENSWENGGIYGTEK